MKNAKELNEIAFKKSNERFANIKKDVILSIEDQAEDGKFIYHTIGYSYSTETDIKGFEAFKKELEDKGFKVEIQLMPIINELEKTLKLVINWES